MATAVKRDRAAEKGGTFRILTGAHLGKGPEGCQCEGCVDTEGKPLGRQNHVYQSRLNKHPADYDGDIIESDQDLEKRHNQGPFSRKFERVGTAVPTVNPYLTQPAPGETDAEFTVRKKRLDDQAATKSTTPPSSNPASLPNFEAMSVKELTTYAEDEEIELGGDLRKDSIVKTIRKALAVAK